MRSLHLLPLIALSLSLSACGTKNRGLESVHQPVVSRTDYVYDVPAYLSAQDQTRLAQWFESINIGYGDRIAIDGAEGDSATRSSVAAVAARYGLLLNDVAPVTEGQIAPGSARVVVSRAKAEVPGCPDWSRTSQPNFNQHSMSNFGCATNSNLAAMVANPEDLVNGRAGNGPSDAQTGSKAIKSYRTTPPSAAQGLKSESTRSGN